MAGLRLFVLTLLLVFLVGCGGGSDSGDDNSAPQEPVPQEPALQEQNIEFAQAGPFNLVVGNTLSNVASGGPGTGAISYRSSDTTIATVDAAGQLTAVGAGTATITAEKAADTHYTAARASYLVHVTLASQRIGFEQPGPFNLVVGNTLSNVASGGPGTGVISYRSSDTTIATVDATGQLTAVGAGTATITAEKAADTHYTATRASYLVHATLAPQRIGFEQPGPFNLVVGNTLSNVASGGPGTGAISYRSSDTTIATVDAAGQLTLVGAGTVTITAEKAADTQYAAASASYLVHTASSRYSNISADGKFLIDVLFVFTPLARSLMENRPQGADDPDDFALRHINQTNSDLQRSQITTSRLRYVGKHYVTAADYSRTNRYPNSSNGTHVLFWLSTLRDAYGADKIAVIHSNVWNNAGGDSASFPYNPVLPFSHEIGHTMGIHHGGCDGGDYSTLGYANGAQFRWLNVIDGKQVLSDKLSAGTVMCGNNAAFFSNANLVLSWQQIEDYVNQGHLPHNTDFYEPLRETGMKMGHVDYADGARQWMEVDEAASNKYPTSLPMNYSETEWYESDDCLAFYDNIDYLNPISEMCIGDTVSDVASIRNAKSVRIGRSVALRFYSNRAYRTELSTMFYSSANLNDYFAVHSGKLSDTVYIEAFHKEDRDAFFASLFRVSNTFGEERGWFTPNGLTVSADGSEIFAMHDGIDIFSPDGHLIRELSVNTAYAFGLSQTAKGDDLIIPTDKDCRIVDKISGETTTTPFPRCYGSDVDIDSAGNIYIVHRSGFIKKFSLQEDGTLLPLLFIDGRLGQPGDNNHFGRSTGIAIDKDRDLMYVVDGKHCRVQVLDLFGSYRRTLGAEPGQACENSPGRGGKLRSPFGIAVDDQGFVYVSESYDPWYYGLRFGAYFNVGVQVFDETGNFVTRFAKDMNDPGYIAVDDQGKIYVMESGGEPSPSLGASKVVVFEKVNE